MNKIELDAKTGEVTESEVEDIVIPNPPQDYNTLVSELIHQKYSIDDEIALNRQREEKPDEWQAYYDYCEECKLEAKSIIEEEIKNV